MAIHSSFLPGELHGWRSLAGYSLWGCKELDKTEWLTFCNDQCCMDIFAYLCICQIEFSQFSHAIVSNSLWSHGLRHTRLSCPSPTPRASSNSCPSSQGCHPTISSSVIPFSSRLQTFPASGSFSMSQFFASGGQSIGASASASVLPINIQDQFPLEWTGWISLQSKGLSRVFSNTTVQKRQFFSAQLSSQSNSHIHTWPQEKP